MCSSGETLELTLETVVSGQSNHCRICAQDVNVCLTAMEAHRVNILMLFTMCVGHYTIGSEFQCVTGIDSHIGLTSKVLSHNNREASCVASLLAFMFGTLID